MQFLVGQGWEGETGKGVERGLEAYPVIKLQKWVHFLQNLGSPDKNVKHKFKSPESQAHETLSARLEGFSHEMYRKQGPDSDGDG